MSSEVENNNTPLSSQSDDELIKLEEDYQKLLADSQSLINERSYLETEIRTLKKRATRLDDEVRLLAEEADRNCRKILWNYKQAKYCNT